MLSLADDVFLTEVVYLEMAKMTTLSKTNRGFLVNRVAKIS